MKVLCGMFMESLTILGLVGLIICSMHNSGGQGCNYNSNSLVFDVWCVTEFEHHSMHLHPIYNHYPSWGLDTNGI